MSDIEQDSRYVAWGVLVPKKPNSRYMWPLEIKAMAAKRVAAGETAAELLSRPR